jgi:hypothetical protein
MSLSMIARFILLGVAALFFSGGALADSIGDVVSVVPAANCRRGGAVREPQVDGLVEQNDRVITTGEGSAYIHFIDDTVLTVGANSEVVLDKFIFDGDKARIATVQLQVEDHNALSRNGSAYAATFGKPSSAVFSAFSS